MQFVHGSFDSNLHIHRTYFVIFRKIEESIPWLVANGKGKHVIRVLKIAAKVSKVPVHDVMLHLHLSEDEQTGTESNMEKKANADGHQEEESFLQKSSFSSQDGEKVGDDDNPLAAIKPYTILDLFRNGRFLMNTCILWFMWYDHRFHICLNTHTPPLVP